jgi:DNA-binding NarL/FixJ family response regulator
MPVSVIVIAQRDQSIAQGLANALRVHFTRILVAENAEELRSLLLRHEARVTVVDMEILSLEEISQLANTFSNLAIVATHRSPDERMWVDVLNAGAVELCRPQDIRSILRASSTATMRHLAMAS